MTRARFFAVLNPNAGFGTAKKRFQALRARIDNSIEIELAITNGPAHATELAEKARAEGHTHFLSIGGDGTTFEVVNGLMRVDRKQTRAAATLAILPLGTGNSFMRDFHVDGVDSALLALEGFAKSPHTTACDLLKLTHDKGVLFSFNQLGLGFVADAGNLTNQKYKRLGVLGYVAAVLERTWNLDSRAYSFSIDGKTHPSKTLTLLAICNSRCTGGTMKMAPDARVDDGLFDLIAIDALSRARLLSCFPKIFSGTHLKLPEVKVHRGKTMTFDLPSSMPTIIDGEVLDIRLQSIEVVPRALSVVGNAYP